MDPVVMRARLAEARVARLATLTRAGRPHVVPCCFALVGDVVYSAVDAKPKTTLALRRLDNIAANPAVSLVVDHYDEDWAQLWWVRVDGEARVVTDASERDHALAVLSQKYDQYRRARPPGPVFGVETLVWRSWP